jgi:pSer/pThr/pTyr-binding forkhead associated (FHA) protein
MPPGSVKTIGRSTGAEFMVDAALVSRLHCQLSATADSLQVKDLDSTNGTFVNGKRVQTAQLRDGDRLAVGRIELMIRKN